MFHKASAVFTGLGTLAANPRVLRLSSRTATRVRYTVMTWFLDLEWKMKINRPLGSLRLSATRTKRASLAARRARFPE